MATRISERTCSKRRPSEIHMPIRYQVLRVPAKGYRGIVCLSHDLIGFDTHYWSRRTMLCLPQNCEPCDHGRRRDWYGWFASSDRTLKKICIMTVTAGASGAIDEYFRKHRTLRGAIIDLVRIPAVAHGRLWASLERGDYNKDDLPKGPNVEAIILNMMRVTKDQLVVPSVMPVIEIKPPPADDPGNGDGVQTHGSRPATVLQPDGLELPRRS